MKQIFVALALVSLTACGFQPVYAPGANAKAGAVAVDPIEGRAGYLLRKELLMQLAAGLPGISDGASLNVDLDDTLTRLAFKPDGAASRTSVGARGEYVFSYEGGTLTGTLEASTNFNVSDAPFADVASQNSAVEREVRELARKIVDDLRLKLADKS